MSGSNVRLVVSVQARGVDGEPRERHPAAGPPNGRRHEPNGDDLTAPRPDGVFARHRGGILPGRSDCGIRPGAPCGHLPSCRKEWA
ncbi:hypothetical protein AB0H12_22005 [Actinosynnema sp. NPDC023794]